MSMIEEGSELAAYAAYVEARVAEMVGAKKAARICRANECMVITQFAIGASPELAALVIARG